MALTKLALCGLDRRRSFGHAALIVSALFLVVAHAAMAEEVRLAAPSNAAQARGTAFLASVTRFYTTDVQDHTLHFMLLHVERVYAGASDGTPGEDPRPGDGRPNEIVEPGVDLAVYQPADGLSGLAVDATYFVSTADIDTPVIGNSVIWKADGNSLEWVQMSPVPGSGDPRFADVRTRSEAIALMATDLPPTDTSPVGSSDGGTLLMLAAGVLGLAAGVRIGLKPSGSPKRRFRRGAACG
jgi:hypothetical protein